jgi:hypothetical protein
VALDKEQPILKVLEEGHLGTRAVYAEGSDARRELPDHSGQLILSDF